MLKKKKTVIYREKAMKPDVKKLIELFLAEVKKGTIEIYNEFSLQHELGIHLRKHLSSSYKVQFERNIDYFDIPKEGSPKKELDISIFNSDTGDFLATIELKFLKNGQFPMRMFNICEDTEFMEHARKHKFKSGYVLVIADEKGFYEGQAKVANKVPYCYFRSGETLKEEIEGKVGQKQYKINLQGRYTIAWHDLSNEENKARKYTLIEIL